ncbi:MAG: sensor histidine kinase [Clostridia bacterium]|nr:sensor histidine kinase [Clostridia bacterium]
MKELSLNILDIAQNSIKAKASLIGIHIKEEGGILSFEIVDDGCGMDQATVDRLVDPFYTTRTTRKVGLGIPFLKMAAEQTGGYVRVDSVSEKADPQNKGTRVYAEFHKSSIDFTPMGDIVSTMVSLIQGADGMDFDFTYQTERGVCALSTMDMREVLGEEIPLSSPEVLVWARETMEESLSEIL